VLVSVADGVVAASNAVNGKLERRQEEIEELNAVRSLLHKLQGVFDLPRRLRAAIEREAFEVAADAYADAAPLLKQYGHKVGGWLVCVGWGRLWVGHVTESSSFPAPCVTVLTCGTQGTFPACRRCSVTSARRPGPPAQGAFKRVAAEVEGCGRELAGILRRRLLAQPDQAAECIQMIAKLGEPTESLQVGVAPAGRRARARVKLCCAASLPCCQVVIFLRELPRVAARPTSRFRRTFWSASASACRACWRRRG
jgi:hypothetical protein